MSTTTQIPTRVTLSAPTPTSPGVIAGSVVRVELPPGPRVFISLRPVSCCVSC